MAALAALAALGAVGGACGGPPPPPRPAAGPPPLAVPLELLVPAGARTLVLARPAEVLETPALRRVLEAVFDAERRRAVGDRTGLYAEDVERLVLAEWPEAAVPDSAPGPAFVLLLRLRTDARDVVRAAGARMNAVHERASAPFERRLGYVGLSLRDFTALDAHTLLVASGVVDAARAIRARVRGGRWPPDDGPALATAQVRALTDAVGQAPLAVLVPEPLRPPGTGSVAILLARQEALGAAFTGRGGDVHAAVTLLGRFPPTAPTNFRALVESVAATDLGAALGITDALETLTLVTHDRGVTLELAIPASALALGLRTLFLADLRELLGGP